MHILTFSRLFRYPLLKSAWMVQTSKHIAIATVMTVLLKQKGQCTGSSCVMWNLLMVWVELELQWRYIAELLPQPLFSCNTAPPAQLVTTAPLLCLANRYIRVAIPSSKLCKTYYRQHDSANKCHQNGPAAACPGVLSTYRIRVSELA